VLFCKDEVQWPDFPQLLLKVARFKGVRRDEFLDNRQFHGNAFTLMRRAGRFLIDSLPVAGRIVPGRMEREDTPLLPVEALREALANAFVHRDYAIGGGSVGVALFDDRRHFLPARDHRDLGPRNAQDRPTHAGGGPRAAESIGARGRGRCHLRAAGGIDGENAGENDRENDRGTPGERQGNARENADENPGAPEKQSRSVRAAVGSPHAQIRECDPSSHSDTP
jgi:hypothetical protein